MKIAIVANTSWYLYKFRSNLIKYLLDLGHQVLAVAPFDSVYTDKLIKYGISFESVPISGSGTKLTAEIKTILCLRRALKINDIDLILTYTPKGNIYSALAAISLHVPFIPNISGLGRVFTKKNWITPVVEILYKATLHRASKVFFQNQDDLDFFVSKGLVKGKSCERLPGSGVDLTEFTVRTQTKNDSENITFILIARLLWDKGVGEYAEAAKQVRKQYPHAIFRLLGFLDVDNPSAVSRVQVQEWEKEGNLVYLGSTDDVRPFITDTDCVVLPSYREGVPRTLLEAAAMGRPVITTDAPGCRDTVVDGLTGFMCQPADADDLSKKIEMFIALSPTERVEMGLRGRKRVELYFDEQLVLSAYKNAIDGVNNRLGEKIAHKN